MKLLSGILAAVLAFSMMFAGMPAKAEETASIYRQTTTIYFYDSTNLGSVETVYFSEEKDIPYLSLEMVAVLLRDIANMQNDRNYKITNGFYTYGKLEEAGLFTLNEESFRDSQVYLLYRENGSFMYFDAANNLIYSSDRDKFYVSSFAVSGGDLVSSDGLYYVTDDSYKWDSERDQAVVNLYKRANANQFVREGDVECIDLDDYSIQLRMVDGMVYIPVATASDLIFPVTMTYNGVSLFVTYGELNRTIQDVNGKTQYDLYYEPGERTRSQALAYFTYNELCLMMDQCYGLATEHRIDQGFDQFFTAARLVDKLCSTDHAVEAEAFYELLKGYLGDLHSGLSYYSPYSGGSLVIEGSNESVSVVEDRERTSRFEAARDAAGISVDGAIRDGYTEIGDTAFITFDSFRGATTDYYSKSITEDLQDIYMNDTVGLVIWAQSRIHREDSPIRKVVIDISLNGGGELNACVYVAAWVLGSANISIENIKTGAQYTTSYWVDTNLDGKCTSADDLGVDSLDVYCLISGNSFSCGNLLPTLFKQDGRVTLVGQTSGGGACAVLNTSAADGTLFRISNIYRLSIVKNGSFYGIDQGVEPDIPLRKAASFYDREGLLEYLKTFR